jgi:hypothetical protein
MHSQTGNLTILVLIVMVWQLSEALYTRFGRFEGVVIADSIACVIYPSGSSCKLDVSCS